MVFEPLVQMSGHSHGAAETDCGPLCIEYGDSPFHSKSLTFTIRLSSIPILWFCLSLLCKIIQCFFQNCKSYWIKVQQWLAQSCFSSCCLTQILFPRCKIDSEISFDKASMVSKTIFPCDIIVLASQRCSLFYRFISLLIVFLVINTRNISESTQGMSQTP